MTKKKTFAILALIMILALGRLVYCFAFEKDDSHIDETWTYGLSNSHYDPFVFAQTDKTTLKNYNEWKTSDLFRDYLTVQEGERFDYASVWYNQKYDDHPPFYYLILNTICSFFPNSFSMWYGFAINIIAFVIMMIFSFRLAKLMTNSDFFALAFCAFLAFCDGALNMFMFVRMYALSAAIFTIFMYFTFRLMKTRNIKKNVPFIALVLYLGAMNHHFFVIAAGLLVFFVSIYYLIRKQIKIMFINGFACLGAVGLSILSFPATIDHLLKGHSFGTHLPFWFAFKFCVGPAIEELFGISVSPFETMTGYYILAIVATLLVILIPLIFLFRDTAFVKNNVFALPKRIWSFLKTHNKTSLCFACICVTVYFVMCILVCEIINVLFMSSHLDRYMFVIFPALALGVLYLIYEILVHIIKKHKWIPKAVFCSILAVFVVLGTVKVGCKYYFKDKEGDISISETVKDSNVILVLGLGSEETNYADDLLTADGVFITTIDYCATEQEKVSAELNNVPDNNKPLYLVINTERLYDEKPTEYSFDDMFDVMLSVNRTKIMEFFENLDVTQKLEYVGPKNIFGSVVEIYKLKD